MAEWLRTLISRTLKHLSSHRCWFEPSLGHMTCGPTQVLLAGGQIVFLWDLPLLPHLMMTPLKISIIILMGCKLQKVKATENELRHLFYK